MRDRKKAQALAHELVSKMTIEERASQLKFDAPPVERLGVPAYNWWNEALHGVARAGTATMFPQPVAMASMFDPEMIRKIGDVVATEARAKYNEASKHGDRDIYKGLTFWSPNINLFRDPRWGRGQETYSEDPYLTAQLGVAYIKGLQGDGKYLKVAACAKHYAVHSGPEAIRHEFDAEVSRKDLWETYLPAFADYAMENRTYRYFTGGVLYPFGYGLTYGKTEVTKAEMRDDGEHYTITATVKNEGCAVHEILQVYVRDNESEFAVRNHSLCAFKAVSLGANETCDVEITVPKAALEIVDDTGTRRVDSRSFTFFVGTSQPDDRSAELLGTRPVAVELKL